MNISSYMLLVTSSQTLLNLSYLKVQSPSMLNLEPFELCQEFEKSYKKVTSKAWVHYRRVDGNAICKYRDKLYKAREK